MLVRTMLCELSFVVHLTDWPDLPLLTWRVVRPAVGRCQYKPLGREAAAVWRARR